MQCAILSKMLLSVSNLRLVQGAQTFLVVEVYDFNLQTLDSLMTVTQVNGVFVTSSYSENTVYGLEAGHFRLLVYHHLIILSHHLIILSHDLIIVYHHHPETNVYWLRLPMCTGSAYLLMKVTMTCNSQSAPNTCSNNVR